MEKVATDLTHSDGAKYELNILSNALEFEYRRATHDFHLHSRDVAEVRALYDVLRALSNSWSMTFGLLSFQTDRNTAAQAMNELRLELERELAEHWSNRFYRAAEGTARILQCVRATQHQLTSLFNS